MDLRLASINGCRLRSDSKRSHLLLHLQSCGIEICCLQETLFDSNFHEGILSREYWSFSAYFDGRSRGLIRLVSRHLFVSCVLVVSDPVNRLCVLDVIIKDKVWQLIVVYEPNANSKLPDFLWCIKPYMIASRWVILVGLERHAWSPFWSRSY